MRREISGPGCGGLASLRRTQVAEVPWLQSAHPRGKCSHLMVTSPSSLTFQPHEPPVPLLELTSNRSSSSQAKSFPSQVALIPPMNRLRRIIPPCGRSSGLPGVTVRALSTIPSPCVHLAQHLVCVCTEHNALYTCALKEHRGRALTVRCGTKRACFGDP